MSKIKIYKRKDLLIVNDLSVIPHYFMTTKHDFAIIEKKRYICGIRSL